MTRLLDLRAPKERFARSINVERDSGGAAIEGYLPVGRAIECVERLMGSLTATTGEAALSVTGPYGSGKSSLALLVDSLLGPADDAARRAANELLASVAPAALELTTAAREVNGAATHGFIRAVVTAQREPVAKTILRALLHGASRYPAVGDKLRASRRTLRSVLQEVDNGAQPPDPRQIKRILSDLSDVAPVLIVIDEFGKNLEAFAEAPGEGDLFLLQELAEWTRTARPHRIALITLQHMAFGDYADGASGVQRREWVKIQGRFEDIPFVDTPEQTRALVAASFTTKSGRLAKLLSAWTAAQSEQLSALGLSDMATSEELLAACWPLHPVSLAVLPDLCQRYGQNERTMFSFLASREPLSVHTFLAKTAIQSGGLLPSVRLNLLYDYFIESASNMVGVSADASRWIEIDTRIRDSRGLSEASLKVLKAVGLLNLVSTGGTLRASRDMITFACSDGRDGTEDGLAVGLRLAELEAAGLLTFRDFADEFRVWQGSDFDLKSAITLARRRLRDEAPEEVLRRVLPLGPVVAARHSHKTGTLRTFERAWVSETAISIPPLAGHDRSDGLIAYVLGAKAPTHAVKAARDVKPIALATAGETEGLVSAARELLAIEEVLATDETVRSDWVVRKELTERQVAAGSSLRSEFELAYGGGAATFHWAQPIGRTSTFRWVEAGVASPSAVASVVSDSYFNHALPFRNELINRHELTSQAAKARREVVEVMSADEGLEGLAITGHGPDRTLYLSLFAHFGLHREVDGVFQFADPPRSSQASHVWAALLRELRSASTSRINVADLYAELALPPIGLREGPAPLLLVAALIAHSDEFALYEHGTFRPVLTADLCERLLKNPRNFETKWFAASSGSRARLVADAAAELGLQLSEGSRRNSVVSVVGRLVAQFNGLPQYSKRTTNLSPESLAVRDALVSATEPDSLLFEDLPRALGYAAISPKDKHADTTGVARALSEAMRELAGAYPALSQSIRASLVDQLRPDDPQRVQISLTRRAEELRDKVIDPRVRALVTALRAEMPDEESWLAYVAMQVSGVPPEGWSDDDRRRFEVILQDVGGTFLRVEALTADVRATDSEFEALRVSVNSTRGGELVRLMTLDPQRRQVVDEVLDEAIERLHPHAGSRQQISEWLLAGLLERELERSFPEIVGEAAYVAPVSENEETA